ncbi:4Fe-4S cluster-binding domain-containing protein [bacterium]|nr:4Fe-4S cluster-binding domain-containing protein [bacterium]
MAKALQEGNLDSLEPEVIRELEENNLIVSKEVDELALVKTLFWRSKFTGNTLSVTILPTYECNMACPYCYEGESRPSTKMGKAFALKVCDWIINQLEGGRYKALNISFYGGEPLLCPNIILLIARTLKAKCDEMTVNFSILSKSLSVLCFM